MAVAPRLTSLKPAEGSYCGSWATETAAWAALKGIGFTASLAVYGGAEFLWARKRRP